MASHQTILIKIWYIGKWHLTQTTVISDKAKLRRELSDGFFVNQIDS